MYAPGIAATPVLMSRGDVRGTAVNHHEVLIPHFCQILFQTRAVRFVGDDDKVCE